MTERVQLQWVMKGETEDKESVSKVRKGMDFMNKHRQQQKL